MPSLRSVSVLLVAASLGFPSLLAAQGQATHGPAAPSAVPSRLTAKIDESQLITLPGVLHPLASAANDRGRIPDSTPLKRIQIVLKKSDAQEVAARQLIDDLHNSASPNFHHWLTPDQFGKQFGPSDADVATLSTWLASKGFAITGINPGHQTLEFEGTAGQFRAAFHTEIHNYAVGGALRHSVNAQPQIPAALAPVFGGFTSLNNFTPRSPIKVAGKATFNPRTHKSVPAWTEGSGDNPNYVLAPGDFAVQYDTQPLLTAGNNGNGQTIAVINISNVDIYLVNLYRKLFNLPASQLQVVVDGADPGINGINDPDGYANGWADEAYLDVELSGMSAPGATIDLVIAGDTELSDGFELASEHAVYNNIAPVMSLSVESCELGLGAQNAFYNTLWQQAAAQGITVVVAASDSGSAGCDDFDTQQWAIYGQQVNGFASTPYNVAVGGTDFYYSNYAVGGSALTNQVNAYWNQTVTPSTPTTSLLGVIPEQPWNNSQFGLDAVNYFNDYYATSIVAGSGGASNCGLTVAGACAPYAKPTWQKGAGVPADSARDLPDVSLFAANGENYSYYPFCSSDGDCQPVSSGDFVQISGGGGTSAATPAFAGIMALINQKYGRQGQANYVLYPLAAQYPAAFHDITVGTNTVPCNIATDPSGNQPYDCIAVTNPVTTLDPSTGDNVVEGEIGSGMTAEYNAGRGYDLASGLGSIDANVLMADWNKVSFTGTTTTLTPSSTSFAHGTSVTVAGSVTNSGGTKPTGQVALLTTSTTQNASGLTDYTLASGSYTGALATLPGGTYSVYGRYGGDTANAASSSNPVSIVVTAEPSATALLLADSNGFLSSGGSISYGTPLALEALPAPTADLSGVVSCVTQGSTCPTFTSPTGSMAFSDAGVTVPLNANGEAYDNYFASVGGHSVTATYSGDASYSASTSSAATFTVTKDTPKLTAAASGLGGNGGIQVFTFLVTNSNNFGTNAVAPTGTLTFSGGPFTMPASATLTAAIDPYAGAAAGVGTVTLPANTVVGTYNVQYSYAGDANYNGTSAAYALTFNAPDGSYPSTITASVSSPSITPGTSSNMTVTVTGTNAGGTPQGLLLLFSDGVFFDDAYVAAGSGISATTIVPLNYYLLSGGNVITVQYLSFNNYTSSEATVSVTNSLADFTLVPTTNVITSTTATVTDGITLGSSGGFTGPVALTCAATGGVTCALSGTPVTLTAGGTGSATLTLTLPTGTSLTAYTAVVTGSDTTGQYVHTATITVNVPPSGFAITAANSITIASQGASGSTTLTLTPSGTFAGNVNLTCLITSGPAGYTDAPVCGVTTPVTVALASTATATLSINTTPQTKGALEPAPRGWMTVTGSTAFATLLLCMLLPAKRRRFSALFLAIAAMLVFGMATGCSNSGSSTSGGGGGTLSGGTTTGNYIVTVTGTDAATGKITASVPVTVTVN